MIKYYKVVINDNEKYKSVIVENEQISVKYIPNEWVEPLITGSKLFVFNDLDLALNFSGKNYGFSRVEVWECEVEGVQKEVFMLPWLRTECRVIMSDFWYKVNNGDDISLFLSNKVIPGTVCVDRVKLIKKIRVDF